MEEQIIMINQVHFKRIACGHCGGCIAISSGAHGASLKGVQSNMCGMKQG